MNATERKPATMKIEGTFAEIRDRVRDEAAPMLGYTREELDRIAQELNVDGELDRILLDAICRRAGKEYARLNGFTGFIHRTADLVASALSEREGE